MGGTNYVSGFLDFTSLNCLGRNQHALHLTAGKADLDLLEIGLEPTAGDGGDVRTDAAAFLRLTLPVDDAPDVGAFARDCADASHVKLD